MVCVCGGGEEEVGLGRVSSGGRTVLYSCTFSEKDMFTYPACTNSSFVVWGSW